MKKTCMPPFMSVVSFMAFGAVMAGTPSLRSQCDLTLSRAGHYSAGERPRAFVSADLDDDGDSDIAVVDEKTDAVRLLENSGNGEFQNSSVTVRRNLLSIAAFPENGRLDLVVAGNRAITFLRNQGSLGFEVSRTIEMGDVFNVAACDLDGDGDTDLAAAVWQTDVVVMENLGEGDFDIRDPIAVGAYPRRVTCSDLDRDGRMDLAVANFNSDDVAVLLNQGGLSFSSPVAYRIGDGPASVTASDFNGDGMPDLATANTGERTKDVSILLNSSAGNFVESDPVRTFPGSGGLVVDVASGDLDGDGLPDLVAAVTMFEHVSVILNADGKGFAEATLYWMERGGPSALTLADFDGNGHLDIAAVSVSGASGHVSLLLNYGRPSSCEGGVQLGGDCNQDGQLDIADPMSIFTLLFLDEQQAFPCSGTQSPGPGDLTLFDWQGDGSIDISDGIAALGFLFLGGPRHILNPTGTLGLTCVSVPGCPDTPRCP